MSSKILHRLSALFCLLIVSSICVVAARGGDEFPAWLSQAAATKPPVYEKNVNAVVLHNEQIVHVGGDGKTVVTRNYAVRLLLREGRREAVAVEPYLTTSGKIREMRGWLVRPDGTTKRYEKDSIIDQISDPDDIYNEYRIKVIDATNDADAGAIFAYQSVTEDTPLFGQDTWLFQDNLPTLISRYQITLPGGWTTSSVTFNRAKVEPVVSGSTYTWELRDLPPIAIEPASPSVANLVPRLAVSFASPNKSGVMRSFSDWTDVSRWNSALSDPSVVIDDAVAAKTRELTANAKTEFEKIRAIGQFVQNLQYISIDIGIGKGNGYRPRSSSLVLQRGYGDCKDKANLMRAMLKILKIEAYPVAIHSGDPTFVREEWVSPGQFNHAIIAVKISDETSAPSVVTHPTLGRLLIFDATDEYTPVGDLPDYLQNSFALVVAGDNGKLLRMPVMPPDVNKLERQAEISLAADGAIKGVIRERANGQSAAYFRREHRNMSATDYHKVIEGWLTRGASSVAVSKVVPTDKKAEGRFDLEVEFTAPLYGQLMQGRLLVFKPAVVSRLNSLALTDAKRTHPVVLESNAFTENATFKLPAGFVVDETPEPVKLETPFGKYQTSYEIKDGQLVFTRSLVLNSATIPVEKYGEVQKFFAQIRTAEQSPVVLLKK